MDNQIMELNKFLDFGAVGAVILVVVIFLKYQTKYNNKLDKIATQFSDKVDNIQQKFEKQVDKLAENFLNTEKSNQQQIQILFNDFLIITKETITAVKELEGSVRELKNEVIKIKKTGH